MFSKAKRKISYLLSAKWSLRRPPRANVAILDVTGSGEILEYLHGLSTHTVDLDRGEVNLWALVRAFARREFDLFGYLVAYLKFVQPKICITMIDTTPFIYQLKTYFPQMTTIAIQNGWRGYETDRDLANTPGPLAIDHVLCFGEVSRDLYKQNISGEFHLVGSFRSNKVLSEPESGAKTVALISTLRGKVRLDDSVRSYIGKPDIPYSVIFERRLALARFVAEFCRSNSLRLLILGKDQNDERERQLYTAMLSELSVDWEFRSRTELLSNYRNLNEARIAVSTSSSLGYEALGRGIRTAFFMLDPEVTGNFGDRFGWPEPYADQGEIWTNFLDRATTLETLQRLHEMPDGTWERLRQQFVPKLISNDPGNHTLVRLLHGDRGSPVES